MSTSPPNGADAGDVGGSACTFTLLAWHCAVSSLGRKPVAAFVIRWLPVLHGVVVMAVLTVINAGNTVVRVVAMTLDHRVVSDERHATSEVLQNGLNRSELVGPLVLVSVVPRITECLRGYAELWELKACAVSCAVAYDPPGSLGADRLANAIALLGRRQFGVVIDCGTATTFTVVNPEGVILGGAIMPGLGTMRDSLAKRTAQLPSVALEVPTAHWGCDTTTSMQIGILQGHLGAISHLASRMLQALPPGGQLVLTGGWSRLLTPHLQLPHVCAPDLTIEGAALAWSAFRLSSGN